MVQSVQGLGLAVQMTGRLTFNDNQRLRLEARLGGLATRGRYCCRPTARPNNSPGPYTAHNTNMKTFYVPRPSCETVLLPLPFLTYSSIASRNNDKGNGFLLITTVFFPCERCGGRGGGSVAMAAGEAATSTQYGVAHHPDYSNAK